MKKTFISFFISFVLLSQFNILFSADTTSCKFFPLHTGDFYLYRIIHTTYCYPPPVYTCDTTYKYSRIFDYLTIGNKKYFRCTNIPVDGEMYNYFIRYDSLSGLLVRYDSSAPACNYEKTLYRLYANLNDTLGSFCTQLINYDYQTCDSIAAVNLFNTQTIRKSFYCQHLGTSITTCYIYLARGFGTYYMTNSYNYSHGTSVTSQYYYNLKGAKINGVVYGDTNMPVKIININNKVPSSYSLSQNYPNPFNPTTNIKYQIKENAIVTLKIYDILGKEIETLVNEKQSPGTYEVNWNANAFPSGVFFYRLEAGDYSETRKMILIK